MCVHACVRAVVTIASYPQSSLIRMLQSLLGIPHCIAQLLRLVLFAQLLRLVLFARFAGFVHARRDAAEGARCDHAGMPSRICGVATPKSSVHRALCNHADFPCRRVPQHSTGLAVCLPYNVHLAYNVHLSYNVVQEFRSGSSRVLITTDVWARGIDVQQV